LLDPEDVGTTILQNVGIYLPITVVFFIF